MEEYKGVKFKVIEIENTIVDAGNEIKEKKQKLLELDKLISKYIKPEKNEGNMSVRANKKNSFFIKKAGSKMTELKKEDIVFVQKIEGNVVYVNKGIPSSESIMHYEIYKNREDAGIILHFHDEKLLNGKTTPETNKKIIEIGPFEYGTMKLAEEAGKISKKQDLIKIKEHGFVIIAKDNENLMEIMKKIYE